MNEVTAVKERPILFNAEMVRAILDGRKTMTRRIVKPQPVCGKMFFEPEWPGGASWVSSPLDSTRQVWRCPCGGPGNRLWVRESAWYDPSPLASGDERVFFDGGDVRFKDGRTGRTPYRNTAEIMRASGNLKFRPSIHMPRWASRITLEVAAMRVERVQDISEADIRAEGFGDIYDDWREEVSQYAPPGLSRIETIQEFFAARWDKINGPGAWDRNDWVWVVEFKEIKP